MSVMINIYKIKISAIALQYRSVLQKPIFVSDATSKPKCKQLLTIDEEYYFRSSTKINHSIMLPTNVMSFMKKVSLSRSISAGI